MSPVYYKVTERHYNIMVEKYKQLEDKIHRTTREEVILKERARLHQRLNKLREKHAAIPMGAVGERGKKASDGLFLINAEIAKLLNILKVIRRYTAHL